MRILGKLIVAGLLLLAFCADAQQVTITGRVIDAKTLEPIPFAHIFIVNTAIGSAAGADGNFTFQCDNLGTADAVISSVGYDPYKKHIVFGEGPLNLGTIKLKTSETILDEVVVKSSRDKAWEKNLKKFKATFLGRDEFAQECIIQNPWVIDIQNDESTHTLTAKSLAPIIVINNALGYMVKFSLKRFASSTSGYSIEGDTYFMLLAPPNPKEGERWEKNRETVYKRSLTNLLRSIVTHQIEGQGFALYTELAGGGGAFTRMSRFSENLGKKIQLADTNKLSTSQGNDKFLVTLPGRLETHYLNGGSTKRVYQDIINPISWIELKSNSVVVNSRGIPADPTAITVSGDMSEDRLSRMLPLDYIPKDLRVTPQHKQAVEILPSLYERIYVHTDRPYYYPGEQLWFKGYINYQTPSFRDSLSNTVYIDLITPTKEIVASKVLQADTGRFVGEVRLPSTLPAGTYNIRAYTNLQRNFGDSTLYVKPIPIVELKDMIERVAAQPTSSEELTITTTKEKYKTREKIEVTVNVTDEEGTALLGDLSMSVTDIKQVSPIVTSEDIVQRYPITSVPAFNTRVGKRPFVVEHGITVKGRFLDNAGKPVRTSLNVIQLKPRDLVLVESDADGYFTINHLAIYDSTRFLVSPLDKRLKGKAVLIENEKPSIYYKDLKSPLKIQATTSVQRDLTYVKDSETRLLDEVEIRGAKVHEEFTPEFRVKRSYGKADYVVNARDITTGYNDMLMALQGRFPGLIIRQAANQGEAIHWVVYVARNGVGSFVLGPQEVLVTVNDAIMSGTPESVLSMIHPSQVETVELRTRTNVLYGNVSNGGVLSVYLKKGESIGDTKTPTMGTVKATGYTFVESFSGPDYDSEQNDQPDFRSLIHWTPIVPVNSKGVATVSFFAADLETTYQIEVEGITSEGRPVKAIKTISVGN